MVHATTCRIHQAYRFSPGTTRRSGPSAAVSGPEDQPAGHPHAAQTGIPGGGNRRVRGPGCDPLMSDELELARTAAASVQQRIAFGERAGQQVRRIGSGFGYEGEHPARTGPRCASVNGFSLHVTTHPLEGSCQEAIRPPDTTCDHFCLLRSTRQTLPPTCGLRRIPVFVPAVSASVRRTTHPSGSRPLDVSLPSQTSAPGTLRAPENRRFPPVSNRVSCTDRMAPSRVQFQLGSRQRRRTTPQSGGRPCVMG